MAKAKYSIWDIDWNCDIADKVKDVNSDKEAREAIRKGYVVSVYRTESELSPNYLQTIDL